MRWSRASVAATLATATLVAGVVAAAAETNRSQWPEGVGVPAVEVDGSRTFSIDPGDDVTFLPGVARPGDVIVCEGIGVIKISRPSAKGPSGLELSLDQS